jgi:DNA-directed RNA polymerase I, II, and III subunit RPABC2
MSDDSDNNSEYDDDGSIDDMSDDDDNAIDFEQEDANQHGGDGDGDAKAGDGEEGNDDDGNGDGDGENDGENEGEGEDEDGEGGYDEDDCTPPTREDDLSEFFESTLLTTNDKEKQTKTQFTIFKDALDKERRRRTLPILTKYEKAKIIGVRAQQIAMGSPIYLPDQDVAKFKTPMEIAQEELRQKRTPLLVRRALDSKKCVIYEDWLITDLIDPFED